MNKRSIVPINFFTGFGFLVEDAQFFTTRSGRPKVTFRMALPRNSQLPQKKPNNSDYYTVVALGDRFVEMVEHLKRGVPVVVFGYVQSRDVNVNGEQRTAHEIAASALYIVRPVGSEESEENERNGN